MVGNRFLKLPNLHVLIKQNSPSLPRNLVFSCASDKSKLFAKNYSKNSNLDDRYLFNCFPF